MREKDKRRGTRGGKERKTERERERERERDGARGRGWSPARFT
jgi:hypothetical protein